MPEEITNNPTPPTDSPPITPAPGEKAPDPNTQKPNTDEVTLTDEQWQAAYKSKRFTELTEAKKERDELKKKEADREKADLEAKGEYQKIAENEKNEKIKLQEKLQNVEIERSIERIAAKSGVVDTDAVIKLIDKTKIVVSETGEITGVDEAVKALLEEKKYLVGNGTTPNVGAPSNPGNNSTSVKKFKLSQLQDAKFYQENEKDITEAYKHGQIENDMHQQ